MTKASLPVPDDISPAQRKLFTAWLASRYPRWNTRERKRELVDACLEHHRSVGNRKGIVDWLAACRNWTVNEVKFERERRRGNYADETPQDMGPRSPVYKDKNTLQEPEPIAKVIELFGEEK